MLVVNVRLPKSYDSVEFGQHQIHHIEDFRQTVRLSLNGFDRDWSRAQTRLLDCLNRDIELEYQHFAAVTH